MKRGLLIPLIVLLCAGVSLSQTEEEDGASRSSFTTYELGQSPCFATEEYKKMYYKCQDIDDYASPYTKTQTCGVEATIPENKDSSCGLEDGQEALLIHNGLREQWGASPLVWSKVLSDSAQAVADLCMMKPSGSEFGENMLLSSGELTCSKSSEFWHESEKLWESLGADNPDFYPDTGTFTQMIWKDTLQVGCAKSECDSGDLVVCHYYPPGNLVGGSNFADNVGVRGEEPPCTMAESSSALYNNKKPSTTEKDGDLCCTKFLGFIKVCDTCDENNERMGLVTPLLE